MIQVFRTIIVDDEQLARQRLIRLLNSNEQINIIGEAVNGKDGLEKIEELKPDLIFLDIEMPVLNGFDMLSQLKHKVKVVFTTAYDQYAVKAFEEESIDYLLKPFESGRLEKTLKRLQQTPYQQPVCLPLKRLLEHSPVKKNITSLTVKIGDKILLIKLDRIVYIDAEEKYVFIHTVDDKKYFADFTINALEERLPEFFVRIHRSTIINSDHIKEIRRGVNGTFVFVMNNNGNTCISSSRSYGKKLRETYGI